MKISPPVSVIGCTFSGATTNQPALTVHDNHLSVASARISVGETMLTEGDFAALLDLIHALDCLPEDSDLKQALVAARAKRRLTE